MTADAEDPRHRLFRLADPRGVIAGIALDHRDSFRVVLEREGMADLTTADLRELKVRLARALAPAATAVMIDEEFGGRALDEGVVPLSVGLIMPLEAQGYEGTGDRRITTLLPDFSPADARARGADACKLLLPYRADDEASAAAQDATVAMTAAACHAVGLPLVIEPVAYRSSTESPDAYAVAYRRLVVSSVERLRSIGADLLKLPFPVLDLTSGLGTAANEACQELAEACADTPWVLLGAGASTGVFLEQIQMAGQAGASGFLAGRGIWGGVLRRDPDETERLAMSVARPALERCREMADQAARPLALETSG